MKSTGLKFCILSLIVQGSLCGNPCDRKPNPPILDASMFLNQSCYFSVINGTESSSTEEWSLFRFEYVFNITNAREMCAMHGATLPIINSEEENRFVASYEAHEFVDEWGDKKIFRVALGMMKNPSTNIYEWDDGSAVSHEPSHGWERKNWPNRDCATVRRLPDEPVWLSFPCHGVGIGRLGVLCKKVINPDCQYIYRSSNSCVWDDAEKKCYEMSNIEVLAPALKGGKECPGKEIKRDCKCKDSKSDWQKDDSHLRANGCDTKLGRDKTSCPLAERTSLSSASGYGSAISHKSVIIVLAIVGNVMLHG